METDVQRLVALARAGADHADWYKGAEALVHRWAAVFLARPERVALVIAATSPRVTVARNLRIAAHFLATGTFPGGVLPVAKRAIETGQLGPKTGPFMRALLGDAQAVVLDVHMAHALGVRQEDFSKPRVHAACSAAVVQAGEAVGLTPRDTQAAIWAGVYREKYPHREVPRFAA